MLKTRLTHLTLTICLLAMIPPSARAEESGSACLEKNLPEILLYKPVTLYTTDGSVVNGNLLRIELSAGSLTIEQMMKADMESRTYQFSELDRIKYRKKGGGIKPLWMLVGVAGGGVTGGVIGYNSSDKIIEQMLGMIAGMTMGAGAGLVLGTFVPLFKGTKTGECQF